MNFIKTLQSLPLPRQIMLGAAVLGVIAVMTMMVRGVMEPPMALLYSGLEPTHAGEIIEELEQQDVPYEIRSGAIFVSSTARDRVRFDLAQQGLPKQAIKGYELLDDVNGFSITSEMYNASYWRAKEGELTRTILAIPGVDAARVHIGASLRSGFSRHRALQTASVTLSASGDLSQQQAEAIQYMVALAVAGLAPEDVAVIDSRYGILAGPNVDKTKQPAVVAEDQAASMEQKIMRLLTARVGAGNAEVSVSVDVTRARELISSVQIDPESRVIRQRTSNDVSEEREGGGGGALTVASNLPEQGEGAAGGSNSTVKNATESVSYAFNETRRETETLPGEVTKVSVAVLLNQNAIEFEEGLTDINQALEDVAAEFEQLIASAAGLDLNRGDVVTVELMPFKALPEEELIPAPGMIATFMDRHLWSAIQAILLGIVAIVLGLFVIRPMFKPAAATAEGGEEGNDATKLATDPIEYLKEYTREREDETAAILQQWLNDDRKQAVNE